jgi:hypothetical protein
MKKIIILISMALSVLSSNAQIKLKTNGYIGLGTSDPQQKIDMRGKTKILVTQYLGADVGISIEDYYSSPIVDPFVSNTGELGHYRKWLAVRCNLLYYTSMYQQPSDEKMKENIKNITNALSTIKKIRSVQYDIKPSFFQLPDGTIPKTIHLSQFKDQMGYIAGEIQKILPNSVMFDSLSNTYGVNYISFIPLITAALQEIDSINELQTNRIDEIEKHLEKINKDNTKPKSAEGVTLSNTESQAYLAQNQPNPFTENTIIEFFLPSTIQKANFYIYDLQGKQIKSMNVVEREHGNIIIHGSELMPGMYYYSLIADGKIIGTEKMVLTD